MTIWVREYHIQFTILFVNIHIDFMICIQDKAVQMFGQGVNLRHLYWNIEVQTVPRYLIWRQGLSAFQSIIELEPSEPKTCVLLAFHSWIGGWQKISALDFMSHLHQTVTRSEQGLLIGRVLTIIWQLLTELVYELSLHDCICKRGNKLWSKWPTSSEIVAQVLKLNCHCYAKACANLSPPRIQLIECMGTILAKRKMFTFKPTSLILVPKRCF